MIIFKEVIINSALIISLSALYGGIYRRLAHRVKAFQVITGLLFGVAAVAVMNIPFHLMPGVIFDGRSVVVGAAGMFGGPLAAVLAAAAAGVYRLWLGGAGAVTGVWVIASSGALGTAYHYLRRGRPNFVKYYHLYAFGMLIHTVMLLLMLTLPRAIRFEVLAKISIPVILIFPVITMVVCRLLLNREKEIHRQKRLHRIVEGTRALLLNTDTKGMISFINEAAAGLLGYQVKELVGKRFLEFIYPGDRERVNNALSQQLQSSDQGSALKLRVVTAGGQSRCINFMVTPAVDSGRVIGLMGVALDVTEQKRAEEARKQSETRYRFMVDTVPFAIISFDPRYNILDWNRAAEQIFGWSREEVVGRNEFELLIPEENMEEMKQLLGSYAQGFAEIKTNINQNLRKDGSVITCRWQDVIIRDSEGGVAGILATAIDVTGQVRLEEQLNQAQKLESVGRLAGGMAHDFNNLLTTILGYSELISMEQGLNDSVAEGIEDIRKSAQRGARLIRQLLAFSRKQILRPERINLNELITDLEKMLKRLIEENIDLVTKLEPEIKQIEADPVQIEQVIMNLAVNSRDAMPEGGKLTIETGNVYLDEDYCRMHPEVQPGHYVLLAVSDNGHGMDEEVRRKVFDPFFTTKEVGKGTGLGLATVYGIVKQSGGYIWVYSEPDQGTVFKTYLPQIKEDQGRREEVFQQNKAGGGTETILLVEDEGSLRELAARVLRKQGYAVIEAANGIEALETMVASSQAKIDLLITDVIMPEMGGKELSRKLLERYPGTKVLYISGYTDNAIVHHGVLDEGVSFLPKPFTPISLAQKVRDTLDG